MKKHIVCFGYSNTHGYCADPTDTVTGGARFDETERWTCLLQQKLGEEYLVLEEGLSGRTTVFPDALHESMDGLGVIYSTLMCHEPVDLLVIMLGTNDTKERLGVNAACIAIGMERLVRKAQSVMCWAKEPNILIVCPPHILKEMYDNPCGVPMGNGCVEKSRELSGYLRETAKMLGAAFLDAQEFAEFNRVDGMHLTAKGHRAMAEKLSQVIPELL